MNGTQFEQSSFTVGGDTSEKYRIEFERIFGKKELPGVEAAPEEVSTADQRAQRPPSGDGSSGAASTSMPVCSCGGVEWDDPTKTEIEGMNGVWHHLLSPCGARGIPIGMLERLQALVFEWERAVEVAEQHEGQMLANAAAELRAIIRGEK